MNNFVFYSPTEFVFGKDAEAQVGTMVRMYGGSKVMIVYGGGSIVRSGLLLCIQQSLQESSLSYCMLSGIIQQMQRFMRGLNFVVKKRQT